MHLTTDPRLTAAIRGRARTRQRVVEGHEELPNRRPALVPGARGSGDDGGFCAFVAAGGAGADGGAGGAGAGGAAGGGGSGRGSGLSERVETGDAMQRREEGVPIGSLRCEDLPPVSCQAVVAAAALPGFLDPRAVDPAALLHPVQHRIQRGDVEKEHAVRAVVDHARDFIPCRGALRLPPGPSARRCRASARCVRSGPCRPTPIGSRQSGYARRALRARRSSICRRCAISREVSSGAGAAPSTAAIAAPRPRDAPASSRRRLGNTGNRWRVARRCGRSFSFA